MVGRAAAAGSGGGLILGDRQAQGACWDYAYGMCCRSVQICADVHFFVLIRTGVSRHASVGCVLGAT
jgi:hypothetical protein